jgi:hypothetical protein
MPMSKLQKTITTGSDIRGFGWRGQQAIRPFRSVLRSAEPGGRRSEKIRFNAGRGGR